MAALLKLHRNAKTVKFQTLLPPLTARLNPSIAKIGMDHAI
jgi:hypothetical protein